jgi:hypothetical protein
MNPITDFEECDFAGDTEAEVRCWREQHPQVEALMRENAAQERMLDSLYHSLRDWCDRYEEWRAEQRRQAHE